MHSVGQVFDTEIQLYILSWQAIHQTSKERIAVSGLKAFPTLSLSLFAVCTLQFHSANKIPFNEAPSVFANGGITCKFDINCNDIYSNYSLSLFGVILLATRS